MIYKGSGGVTNLNKIGLKSSGGGIHFEEKVLYKRRVRLTIYIYVTILTFSIFQTGERFEISIVKQKKIVLSIRIIKYA